MISDDIDQILRDYYQWARTQSPDDIGYPHIDPVRRLRGSGIGAEGLSDDEARYIDAALCLLKGDMPTAHRVIERVYGEGKSLRWMEMNGEGYRRTLAELAAQGRQFVKGVLFGLEISKEKSGDATSALGRQ